MPNDVIVAKSPAQLQFEKSDESKRFTARYLNPEKGTKSLVIAAKWRYPDGSFDFFVKGKGMNANGDFVDVYYVADPSRIKLLEGSWE